MASFLIQTRCYNTKMNYVNVRTTNNSLECFEMYFYVWLALYKLFCKNA